MKKGYNWYRHHAWGGLAILSLFTGLHALASVPWWITYPIGGFLLGYVILFLILTYRNAGELKGDASLPTPDATTVMNRAQAKAKVKKFNPADHLPTADGTTVINKAQAKIEKKKRKREAKREKKSGKAGETPTSSP